MGNLGEILQELEDQMESLAEKLEKHGSGDQSAHGNWAHGGSNNGGNSNVDVAPNPTPNTTNNAPSTTNTTKPKSDYVSPASTKRKFSPQEIEDAIKNDDIEVFKKLTHTAAMRAYASVGNSRNTGRKAFEDGIKYWEQKTSHGEKPVKLSSLRKPKR